MSEKSNPREPMIKKGYPGGKLNPVPPAVPPAQSPANQPQRKK